MVRPVIVNTLASGGAATAAFRLHQQLRRCGVDSGLICRDAAAAADEVRQAAVRTAPFARFIRRAGGGRCSLDGTSLVRANAGCELFTDCRSDTGMYLDETQFDRDVINLHWVSLFLDLPTFFRRFAGRVPIVWTLHDMQPFTGGCHYDAECGRYQQDCGHCPQLQLSGEHDASAQILNARKAALNQLDDADLHVVVLCNWMRQCVGSSALGRFPVSVIPNGIDTSVFSPVEKHAAKAALGIDVTQFVILFVADILGNPRKGFDLLLGAMPIVQQQNPGVALASVGSGEIPAGTLNPRSCLQFGRVSDERFLRIIYSAADLFVIPSRQDNLPNTVLEAMSCGTPVAGCGVGGIPDMVRPSETGWLTSEVSAEALADTVSSAARQLSDPAVAARIGVNCRALVESEYSSALQAERYLKLFRELQEQR